MNFYSIPQVMEIISAIIVLIAMGHGIALKSHLPKELTSLNLIIVAMFFMAFRRVFRALTFSIENIYIEIVTTTLSMIIAICMLLAFKKMHGNIIAENNN